MKRHLNTHNRERQRVPGTSAATVRSNNHKMEDPDADVDAPDSQDHTNMQQNIHIHELDSSTTITVVSPVITPFLSVIDICCLFHVVDLHLCSLLPNLRPLFCLDCR